MSFLIILSFLIFELLFFFFLSNVFGWIVTFLTSFLTMAIGILIIRFFGMSIFTLSQYGINRRNLSLNNWYSSIWLLFAAFLLLIPGFLSDLVGGILLVFHASKSLKLYVLENYVYKKSRGDSKTRSSEKSPGPIIEGEYSDLTNTDKKN